jgi:hypothetical protein
LKEKVSPLYGIGRRPPQDVSTTRDEEAFVQASGSVFETGNETQSVTVDTTEPTRYCTDVSESVTNSPTDTSEQIHITGSKQTSQNAVRVTKFKFVEQMYSLLSDEELMQPQNLVFGDNPFARVGDHGRNHCFGDIETSSWYKRTQQAVCRNKNEVLMPIILFCDKTYVKSKPAEALSFTFGILKSHARNNPRAWRNLGMIPGKLGDLIPQGKYNQAKKDRCVSMTGIMCVQFC